MRPTKPRPITDKRCAHCGATLDLSRQQMAWGDGKFRWACVDIAACADREARAREAAARERRGERRIERP